MKFIVDKMPKSKSKCPFSEWKPYPPIMEKPGHYICKINHNGCNLCETECQFLKQEAKTGYWIDSAGNDKCSICGAEYSDLYPDYSNTHFCPNCGAKMEGDEGVIARYKNNIRRI